MVVSAVLISCCHINQSSFLVMQHLLLPPVPSICTGISIHFVDDGVSLLVCTMEMHRILVLYLLSLQF